MRCAARPGAPPQQIWYSHTEFAEECITFCQNPNVLAMDLKIDKQDKALTQV